MTDSPDRTVPAEPPLPGYTPEELLRTRGATAVYRATRDVDGATVALKVAPADTPDAARLAHENAALGHVRSASVVARQDFLETPDRVALVLDWCRGGTLRSPLAAGSRVPRDRSSIYALRDLARELLVALNDVHAAGVIHRDVKPSNVFLTEFGEARLGDFGIALLPGERVKRDIVVGSAAYLSPEQARGEAVDERSDLYSLGLVLHELATGRQVFAGPDFAAKLHRAATETVPPLASVAPDVPASFSRFVADLTARDRALRPRTALRALERLCRSVDGVILV